MPLWAEATKTSVAVVLIFSELAWALASMIENTRSMPILTPTHGTWTCRYYRMVKDMAYQNRNSPVCASVLCDAHCRLEPRVTKIVWCVPKTWICPVLFGFVQQKITHVWHFENEIDTGSVLIARENAQNWSLTCGNDLATNCYHASSQSDCLNCLGHLWIFL